MLSLCMITKDEQEFLPNCLRSVKGLVDEIIVVDTGSKDNTIEIAKQFGAKVVKYKWSNDFSNARNFSLKHATKDWIIVLDADEIISKEDHSKIKDFISAEKHDAFFMIQRNYTNATTTPDFVVNDNKYEEGKEFAGWFANPVVRLFRNKEDIFFEAKVHESVEPCLLRGSYSIGSLQVPIHHFFYKKGSEVMREKFESYLKLGKEQIKLTPGDPKPYYEAGVIHMQVGNTKKAVECFEKVLSLDSNYRRVYLNLGVLYMRKNQDEEAMKVFKDGLKVNAKDGDILVNMGVVYLKKRDYEEAIESFRKAIEIKPRNPQAYNNLGAAYLRLKRLAEAKSAFEKAVELGHPRRDELRASIRKLSQVLDSTSIDYSFTYSLK